MLQIQRIIQIQPEIVVVDGAIGGARMYQFLVLAFVLLVARVADDVADKSAVPEAAVRLEKDEHLQRLQLHAASVSEETR